MLRDAGISFDSFDSEKVGGCIGSTAQTLPDARKQDGQATPSPAQQSGKLIAYDATQKYYEHRFLAHLDDEVSSQHVERGLVSIINSTEIIS